MPSQSLWKVLALSYFTTFKSAIGTLGVSAIAATLAFTGTSFTPTQANVTGTPTPNCTAIGSGFTMFNGDQASFNLAEGDTLTAHVSFLTGAGNEAEASSAAAPHEIKKKGSVRKLYA